MRECFSCPQGKSQTIINSLELHKRIYEQTGKAYWFFRENETAETQIADETSFKIIIEKIKNNTGAEWRHISEFGQSSNGNVYQNTSNEKPKTTKRKRKSKEAGEPLEGNI